MTAMSGGCQCGAVRYHARNGVTNTHVCYCRMCQKAAGNYFMPLGRVDLADFEVTRGEIAWFSSSDHVRRGFCPACGTPLVYQALEAGALSVTLGSLDDPSAAPPAFQAGPDGKLALVGVIDVLPWEEGDPQPWYDRVGPSNRQHPDHDTAAWPPASLRRE